MVQSYNRLIWQCVLDLHRWIRGLNRSNIAGFCTCPAGQVGKTNIEMAFMQRRALLRISGMALAGGGLPSSTTAIADQGPSYTEVVSVKDRQFGATGDSQTDDTRAIQAAVNYCYGSPLEPHGTEKVTANRVLQLPPGTYRITSPIKFSKLHGARIIGSGRFVTKIVNDGRGSVFATNGCGYSHFEGMYLQASDQNSPVLDLNWDGTPGGPALQSNSFIDM